MATKKVAVRPANPMEDRSWARQQALRFALDLSDQQSGLYAGQVLYVAEEFFKFLTKE